MKPNIISKTESNNQLIDNLAFYSQIGTKQTPDLLAILTFFVNLIVSNALEQKKQKIT